MALIYSISYYKNDKKYYIIAGILRFLNSWHEGSNSDSDDLSYGGIRIAVMLIVSEKIGMCNSALNLQNPHSRSYLSSIKLIGKIISDKRVITHFNFASSCSHYSKHAWDLKKLPASW